MKLHLEIPDDIAVRLGAGRGDLSRRALEALALAEFRVGHVTKPELRRLLGFATRGALDGFLKSHGVFEEYTAEDLEHEREGLRRIGLDAGGDGGSGSAGCSTQRLDVADFRKIWDC